MAATEAHPRDRDSAPEGTDATGTGTDAAAGPPFADCVQCGEPTEYPVTRPGIVLCPVCEWQEAERSACSG
ncbi:hypothetical protein QOM21_09255 [Streptomyces sp. Pv4-95]|uniref:hypothetical protein n=1 Tax=Streptomyces sp. Pv4-95 TaxID=3049543 RepID=UPI003891C7CA